MRQRIFLGAVCLIVLAGCAPTADDPGRVEIEQLTQELSYFPHQTGAVWRYLPEGASLGDVRVNRRVEGPAILEGDTWIAWRSEAPGFIYTYYRQYRDDGVYLRERRSASDRLTFDPPLQEYPSERQMRVGASWGGVTTATAYFPEARPENRQAELTFEYEYRIVDERQVTVAAGRFDVFVINLDTKVRDEDGEVVETLQQEVWFTPYVGEVRTEQGHFLVETNFEIDTIE